VPGAPDAIGRRDSFTPVSPRSYYPGEHGPELQINGRTFGLHLHPQLGRRLMTIQTPPDPTAAEMAEHLPQAIKRFLREADPQHKANAHDLLAAFATDATVIDDDGHTYTGHDEIHRWREAESCEYSYTVEVNHVEKFDDTHYVVTNHLEGDFPGGVVDIIYRFTLANDLITNLEIAS
jgi:hypothetical protein